MVALSQCKVALVVFNIKNNRETTTARQFSGASEITTTCPHMPCWQKLFTGTPNLPVLFHRLHNPKETGREGGKGEKCQTVRYASSTRTTSSSLPRISKASTHGTTNPASNTRRGGRKGKVIDRHGVVWGQGKAHHLLNVK